MKQQQGGRVSALHTGINPDNKRIYQTARAGYGLSRLVSPQGHNLNLRVKASPVNPALSRLCGRKLLLDICLDLRCVLAVIFGDGGSV